MPPRALAAALIFLGLTPLACDTITSIAVSGADFGGATADAHCDRRFVSAGGHASAFCQEITGTVAASQFSDDCRNAHEATPGPGLCPREQIIAGCKLLKNNDDHSLVWDWFYDVDDLLPDAGSDRDAAVDAEAVFDHPIPRTVGDVAIVCADPTRYDQGAVLATP